MQNRLLIVDDDPQKAKLYSLFAEPIKSDIASNFDEAMQYCKNGEYDYVLCDENIGNGESGHDVIERIHARHPQTEIFWYSATPPKMVNGFKCADVNAVYEKISDWKKNGSRCSETKFNIKLDRFETALKQIPVVESKVNVLEKGLQDLDKTVAEHTVMFANLNEVAKKNVFYARGISVFLILSFGFFSWFIYYLRNAEMEQIKLVTTILMAHVNAK